MWNSSANQSISTLASTEGQNFCTCSSTHSGDKWALLEAIHPENQIYTQTKLTKSPRKLQTNGMELVIPEWKHWDWNSFTWVSLFYPPTTTTSELFIQSWHICIFPVFFCPVNLSQQDARYLPASINSFQRPHVLPQAYQQGFSSHPVCLSV